MPKYALLALIWPAVSACASTTAAATPRRDVSVDASSDAPATDAQPANDGPDCECPSCNAGEYCAKQEGPDYSYGTCYPLPDGCAPDATKTTCSGDLHGAPVSCGVPYIVEYQ